MIRRLLAAVFPPSNIKRLVGVDHLGNKYYEVETGNHTLDQRTWICSQLIFEMSCCNWGSCSFASSCFHLELMCKISIIFNIMLNCNDLNNY